MEEQKVQDLIVRCKAFFRENNYTQHRIARYESMWRNGILKFMSDRKLTDYSTSIGEEYMQTCHHEGNILPQDRDFIRSVQVLDDMLKTDKIRRRGITPAFFSLDGPIGGEMEKLIVHLINLRRSRQTIKDYRRTLHNFLIYLTDNNIYAVKSITELHVSSFVDACSKNKANIVLVLRALFRFWQEKGIVNKRFDDFFDSYKVRRQERIPSFYTAEEVARIESAADRNSPTGKRDYAIVLLASRLGLRAADIANLSFDNIDWDNSLITLTMKKTGKEIELPLLVEIGNAIIDYLKNGRPETSSNNLFISARAPYADATNAMVCSVVNRIIAKTGIDVRGRHHGAHSLRHSLATAMLYDGTAMSTISEALGHKSTETTLRYLRIDIPSLKKCALPVPEVPVSFYVQKGGAFYD